MGKEGNAPDIFRKIFQTAGVIIMPMADHNGIQFLQINMECLRIAQVDI